MVEDVALNRLVCAPLRGIGKAVNLQGDAALCGGQLAHQQGHPLMDAGMVLQISGAIGAEGADIGQVPGVGHGSLRGGTFPVGHADFLQFRGKIIAQKVDFLPSLQLRFRSEPDGIKVNLYRAFDTPTAGIDHPSPIGKRFGNEVIGRDSGDGFIKVLDADGGQCNVDHIPIGVGSGHHNPITNPHHSVAGKGNPGRQSEDGVFEDEHQHRRKCR